MFEITRMMAEGLASSGHRVAIAYGIRPETPSDVRDRVGDSVELIPLPWTDRRIGAQVRVVAPCTGCVAGGIPPLST